jgi:hypothetical protein
MTAEQRKDAEAKREAELLELDALRQQDTAAALFADKFALEFEKLAPATIMRLAMLACEVHEAMFAEVTHVEVFGTHIPVRKVEFPNATVGVDAAGNLADVEFTERVVVF